MSLEVECHAKGDFTQNGMSLNGILLKMELNSKWNVTQNEMSP